MARAVTGDIGVQFVERVAGDAVRLIRASTVALRMAEGAYGLHVEMVLGGVAEVLVVFVPALPESEDVTAVGAGPVVRVRPPAAAHFYVDALVLLTHVAVTRRIWRRTGGGSGG
ncbi:hypothetical protein [Burkholderia ubonensis]|uniref:hypothetical protein n=1 Tax=Burkholderia ubonensis TaxID=101571 RepID=UPI00076DE68D|nr:hypothetical protein [Burkholderia ubonensis]KVP48439.1 hypothetical protein WJ90_15175 [Burkholderia ubonensis]